MADLPSVADRLNDVEINANQPVTQTLFQRIGSNVNFLLDLLGIDDGSTISGTSQSFTDFLSALELIRNHTITLQANVNTTGSFTIGTFPNIPFVNHVLWARRTGGGGLQLNYDAGGPSAQGTTFFKTVDSGPKVSIEAARVTPSNVTTGNSEFGVAAGGATQYFKEIVNKPDTTGTGTALNERVRVSGKNERTFGGGTPGNSRELTKTSTDPREAYTDPGSNILGYEAVMREKEWAKAVVIDWREYSTDIVIEVLAQGTQFDVYLGYELNVTSSVLFD